MLTLYHSPTTRSFRIAWLLGELGIEYKKVVVDFYNGERDEEWFAQINPMKSFPVIEDDGFVLIESGAIINYLIENYGGGRFQAPAGSKEKALVDQWMYWSESLPAIHQRAFWDHCAPPPGCGPIPTPEIGREGRRAYMRCLDILERHLADDGFIVGEDLTGADFMVGYTLYYANFDHWLRNHPKTKAYLDRLAARPEFDAAIADSLEMCLKLFPPRPSPAASVVAAS